MGGDRWAGTGGRRQVGGDRWEAFDCSLRPQKGRSWWYFDQYVFVSFRPQKTYLVMVKGHNMSFLNSMLHLQIVLRSTQA